MKRLTLLLAILSTICIGCTKSYRDTTLYQHGGKQKAIVAVLPSIVLSDEQHLSWDLSQEFTEEIRRRMFDSSRVYLLRDASSTAVAKALNTPNPNDIAASVIEGLGAAEYVVVTELVDQSEAPLGSKRLVTNERPHHEVGGAILSLAMRVRVIDIRHETPRIILQEVVEHEHLIPRAYLTCDYSKTPWGSESFLNTPLGVAHNRLVRELVSRVEGYIDSSR